MITMPPQDYRTVCPNCTNPTGVTLCSVTIYGGAMTVYLGCSCCDHAWSDVAVDRLLRNDPRGSRPPRESRVVLH